MTAIPDSVRWYATLLLMTLAFAPLARLLAGRLAGKGAFIAKPVGLLATVWPAWFLASISPIPFSTVALWLTIVVGAVIGWGLLIRNRAIDRSWLLHLAAAELIALVAFVAFIGLRGYTPQISGTEKPMDVALLSASARATEMPPPDPWMAGEPINYYYLGYLLHGSLARMSEVPTWVGFNLALATTFAMTVTAAAGLGYGLVRSRFGRGLAVAAGALTVFLIAIAGNLRTPLELLRDPRGTWDAFWWQGIGWESSRVVIDTGSPNPETINEFPSFSFILGDLHPHVMALPVTIVCLAIALNFFLQRGEKEETSRFRTYAPLVVAGAVIGSLYPLNSWDFPTYLMAAVIALVLAFGWTRATLWRVIALGAASVLAWAPFWVTFVPFAGGTSTGPASALDKVPVIGRLITTVAAYSGERTSAGEFLTVFGLPWAIAVTWLAVEAVRAIQGETVRVSRPAAIGGVVLFVVSVGLPAPVLVLAGAPLAASIWLLARRDDADPERTIIATLFAAGFGLILITEFFYIDDVFAGRMNTLFKVYYQVWTLFGIAAALAIIRLWRSTSARQVARTFTAAAVVAVVLAGVSYPIVSAKGWTEWQGPRNWAGLDGAAYLDTIAPDDLAAIHWLADNAKDEDVVLEAPGCSYQVNGGEPTSRMSAFTGTPTVIGWGGHESQWRAGQAELLGQIGSRSEDVSALYANPGDAAGLDRFGVTLLVVGAFERNGASSCAVAGPFLSVAKPNYPGDGWTQVFASGETRIFRHTG